MTEIRQSTAPENWLDRLDRTLENLGRDGHAQQISADDLYQTLARDISAAGEGSLKHRHHHVRSLSRDQFAQAIGERIAEGKIKAHTSDPRRGVIYSRPDPAVAEPEIA